MIFITVKDACGLNIINLNQVSFIYPNEGSVCVCDLNGKVVVLSYNSSDEARVALKEISDLIEEKTGI